MFSTTRLTVYMLAIGLCITAVGINVLSGQAVWVDWLVLAFAVSLGYRIWRSAGKEN